MKWPARRLAPSRASHGSIALAASRGEQKARRSIPPICKGRWQNGGPNSGAKRPGRPAVFFPQLCRQRVSGSGPLARPRGAGVGFMSHEPPHKHVFSCKVKPEVRVYMSARMPTTSTRIPTCPLAAHMLAGCRVSHSLCCTRAGGCVVALGREHSLRCSTQCVCVCRPSQSWILAAALCWTRVRWYEFLTCRIDPADMDERVARPRSYFVLVRSDEALWRGAELDEVANRLSRSDSDLCLAAS